MGLPARLHLAAQQVHLEIGDARAPSTARRRRVCARRCERLEASEQLAERERLDEVVVAAGFEALARDRRPRRARSRSVTGVVFDDARSVRITVRPSMPGSMRSTTSAS